MHHRGIDHSWIIGPPVSVSVLDADTIQELSYLTVAQSSSSMRSILQDSGHAVAVIARDAGEGIAGGAMIKPLNNAVDQVDVFVRPGYRRTGLGRALLSRVVDAGQAKIVQAVANDDAGRKLYEAFGFRDWFSNRLKYERHA